MSSVPYKSIALPIGSGDLERACQAEGTASAKVLGWGSAVDQASCRRHKEGSCWVCGLPFSKCLASEEAAFPEQIKCSWPAPWRYMIRRAESLLSLLLLSSSVTPSLPSSPASAILQLSQMKQQFQNTHLSLKRKKERKKNQSFGLFGLSWSSAWDAGSRAVLKTL